MGYGSNFDDELDRMADQRMNQMNRGEQRDGMYDDSMSPAPRAERKRKDGSSDIIDVYKKFWKNMLLARGCATRLEYWVPILINNLIFYIIGYILNTLISLTNNSTVLLIFTVPFIIASIVVCVGQLMLTIRRLHDINKSGWSIFINLIPIAGAIIFLVWTLMPTDPDSSYRLEEEED